MTPVNGGAGGVRRRVARGTSGPGPTTEVREIAAGHYHSCARMADATVRCWGYNYGGMIGDGTSGNVRLTPVPVYALSGAIHVLASYTDSCAQTFYDATAGGAWRCWGSNNYGQLGDGTTTEQQVPVAVLAGLAVRQLSLGVYHSCAAADRQDGHLLRRELRRPARGRHEGGQAHADAGPRPHRRRADRGGRRAELRLAGWRHRELLGKQRDGSAGRRHDGRSTKPGAGPRNRQRAEGRGRREPGVRPPRGRVGELLGSQRIRPGR